MLLGISMEVFKTQAVAGSNGPVEQRTRRSTVWQVNTTKYPILSEIGKDVLPSPSQGLELVFKMGNIISDILNVSENLV